MMRGLLVMTMCLALGCTERLVGVNMDLSVQPQRLELPPTAVGATTQALVTLTNGSRRQALVAMKIESPFSVVATLIIPAGTSVALPIEFSPTKTGIATATLTIDGEGDPITIPVAGEGIPTAVCVAPDQCTLSTLNVAQNVCIETPAPDGTACSNACLTGGQCHAGRCQGTAMACDDHDACTTDACQATTGCVHIPTTCVAPANPCLAAYCDPVNGCATAPAADGTACGTADCTTAHVCLAGVCEVRAVPEGATCGTSSPCRALGRCVSNACQQPAATPLVEAWNKTLTAATAYAGVTDPSGNLYWVECGTVGNRVGDALPTCTAVSVTSGGIERFRSPLTGNVTASSVRQLYSDGKFIIATGSQLTAITDTLGAVVWSRGISTSGGAVSEMAADTVGSLHVIANLVSSGGGWQLITYDLATGTPRRSRSLPGRTSGLVIDAANNSYFLQSSTAADYGAEDKFGGAASPPSPNTLISLTSAGVQRFAQSTGPADAPAAVSGDQLILTSGDAHSTATGGLSLALQQAPHSEARPPLVAAQHRFEFRDANGLANMLVVTRGTSSPISLPLGNTLNLGHSLMLADGSALFAALRPADSGPSLRAVTATGAERFVCELATVSGGPGPTPQYNGVTTMSGGKWVTVNGVDCPTCVAPVPQVVRSFSLPGETLAPGGWAVSSGGSVSRTQQAR